ncbi:MAG: hypothetical protein FWE91_02985 [Defluviitaleaceae bacterium]|nr:hypothetical protein [Defluviitaleaceae bacterium]
MKRPYAVGIAGCTQSGKSTFAKELGDRLQGVKFKTFHIDHYHKPRDVQPLAAAAFGFEHRDRKNEVFLITAGPINSYSLS